MARRPPRPDKPRQAPTEAGGRGAGFDSLKALRGKLKPPAAARSQATPRPAGSGQPESDSAAAPSEEDSALFKAALKGAVALPPVNRVILEAEKPSPRPRPRPAEGDQDAPLEHSAGTSNDKDLFELEMRGVRPIRHTDRLDLGPAPLRHGVGARSDPASVEADIHQRLLDHLPSDISPDDPRALLDWALQGTRPIRDDNRAVVSAPPVSPHPVQRQADERSVLVETLESPLSLEDRLDSGEETAFLRPGIPRRVLTDLRRGRWVVQGQLDLHGLVRDEARTALALFLAESLHLGRRCVRLIHGKGLGSPGRIPVLKHLSRGWLAQREEILAFCQAAPHDGGGGALLILLRASAPAQPRSK